MCPLVFVSGVRGLGWSSYARGFPRKQAKPSAVRSANTVTSAAYLTGVAPVAYGRIGHRRVAPWGTRLGARRQPISWNS